MSAILILAASEDLNTLVASIPDHAVRTVDRSGVEQAARPELIGHMLATDAFEVPEIVILGEQIPVGEALSIAQMIDSILPGIEMMLVAEPDTDIALRAMRVGVREIFAPTISTDELKVLLHRATSVVSSRQNPQQVGAGLGPVANGRVIVIASPKGGVGKSTIATNVSVALAAHGPMETVLVDLDIQFGDAATLLNLNPVHSIADAFGAAAALDTLVLKTFLTVHPAGFYVLCGAESPTVGDEVSADHVKHLLGQLASQFRNVIVDTSAGLSEHTLAALEVANDVILVSTMDVSSIRSLRKEIDVLTELALLPSSRHVVLNMADRNSGLVVRDVEGVVGMPVNVVIPRSAEVTLAGNRGETLNMTKRPSSTATAMLDLSKRFTVGRTPGHESSKGTEDAEKKRGKRRGDRK